MFKVTDKIIFKSPNGKEVGGEIIKIYITKEYETIVRLYIEDAISAGFDYNSPVEMNLKTFKERVTK